MEFNMMVLREMCYQQSMCVGALLKGLGMFSENLKVPGKFSKEDFEALIEEFQLSHNQIISNWNDII